MDLSSGWVKQKPMTCCIWCFSAKYMALWRNGKGWVGLHYDNGSEGSSMATLELLFQ
jgi:hypothetical protein